MNFKLLSLSLQMILKELNLFFFPLQLPPKKNGLISVTYLELKYIQ